MMRKLLVCFAVLAIAFVCCNSPVRAAWTPTWQTITFDEMVGGAISYDASGGNVVVSGSAYHSAVSAAGNPTSFQQIGGDGIDNPISGNFAMFAVIKYSDPDSVLSWATSNPETPFALEIRAWGVEMAIPGVGTVGEHFTLDAKDLPGVAYLTTTFAELGGWGNVDVTQGQGDVRVWLDIALDETSFPGQAALSVVIDGYQNGWDSFEAALQPGELQGYTPGTTPGSGFRVGAVPEPTTLLIWSVLGVLGMIAYGRRK